MRGLRSRLLPSAVLALIVIGAAHAEPVLIGFQGSADPEVVRHGGGRVTHVFRCVPAIAADLPAPAIAALQRNPRVEYIEPDRALDAVTLDPEIPWGIERVGANQVWNPLDPATLGSGVKVAVIDTGIDYTHPDLAGRYEGGQDFVNNDDDPMDDHGHGTHVSGTIAAVQNGAGVVGVAPQVRIYAYKFLNAAGSGSTSNEVKAIEAAIQAGARVINMSYGSGVRSKTEEQALIKAYNAGILLVAAAGNGANGARSYPAAYDSVMSVAAIDSSNVVAWFSTRNSDVEIAAPGVDVLSTVPGGGYASWNGTSMATPHVVGVAALVRALHPTWTVAKVRQALTATAVDLGAVGRDPYYGYGRVNAPAAVAYP